MKRRFFSSNVISILLSRKQQEWFPGEKLFLHCKFPPPL